MRSWLWGLVAATAVGCCASPASPPVAEEESEPAAEVRAPASPSSVAELERLARADPVGFLERCRDRTAREVHSYSGTLLMQERVGGKVSPPERIAFAYRDRPYSIRMEWQEGAKLARKTLYVEGENDGRMLVLPAGWRALAGIVERLPDSEDARSSSRMPITQFGMQLGIERTLATWRRVRERGELKVSATYPTAVPELGERPVLELRRTGYKGPEDDGICEARFYYDLGTGLQVGIHLLAEDGGVVGKYFFRDLNFSPQYGKDTFTREGLR